MAALERVKPTDINAVMGQGKELQDSNKKLTKGMQKMNLQNMLDQGMNNMFNAGIQALSQATASARDVFSAIGRNM